MSESRLGGPFARYDVMPMREFLFIGNPHIGPDCGSPRGSTAILDDDTHRAISDYNRQTGHGSLRFIQGSHLIPGDRQIGTIHAA